MVSGKLKSKIERGRDVRQVLERVSPVLSLVVTFYRREITRRQTLYGVVFFIRYLYFLPYPRFSYTSIHEVEYSGQVLTQIDLYSTWFIEW